jgi:hypothetical protein
MTRDQRLASLKQELLGLRLGDKVRFVGFGRPGLCRSTCQTCPCTLPVGTIVYHARRGSYQVQNPSGDCWFNADELELVND